MKEHLVSALTAVVEMNCYLVCALTAGMSAVQSYCWRLVGPCGTAPLADAVLSECRAAAMCVY
eukprot:1146391-Pelagomonas_calceolata.AAC.2